MLDENGHCLLTDFGVAKELLQEDTTKTLIGTPMRIAPEVLLGKGKAYDLRADYYSLGCLVFELADGVPPYKGLDNQTRSN